MLRLPRAGKNRPNMGKKRVGFRAFEFTLGTLNPVGTFEFIGPFGACTWGRPTASGGHVLDQYKNAGNPLAHYDGTAEEIAEQCDGADSLASRDVQGRRV